MATNKLVIGKEVDLKILECELKAIEELISKVNSQVNRLQIELMDMQHQNRQTHSNNPTTRDHPYVIQVSSEIVIPVESESQQINATNLNLSVKPALELSSNSDYEESSENEDST
ncbi:uncharacterized protein LOC124343370 [Daphnia pulicaria]|uniref:uncharacterized protein LOC124343370 n=1 Tax=Daphnia pulicaria TaxID=35523 RepID=UPI001EEA689D|nr:uncharacterized protein LOC124343370 [Daphnia pulicaria]